MAYLTLTKSKLIHLATLCEANEFLLNELDEKLEGDTVFTNYDVVYTSSLEEGYIKLYTDNDYIKLQVNWKKNVIKSKDELLEIFVYLNNWYCLRKRTISPRDTRLDILIGKECVSGYLVDY